MTNDLTVAAANSMPALCRSMDDYMNLSQVLADSLFVPKDFRNRPADVLAAVLYGRSVGLDPMQALQSIGVINGKPSIYGDAALGLVRSSGIPMTIEETIEGEGDKMVAVCKVTRGKEKFEARFSVDDAKRASLLGKTGPWQQYPRRMLGWRARGFVLRDAFPDVLKGLITREEAQDYPQEPMKNVTPPEEPKFFRADRSKFIVHDADGVIIADSNRVSELLPTLVEMKWTPALAAANRGVVLDALAAANAAVADRPGNAKIAALRTQAQEVARTVLDLLGDDDTADGMIDQPEMADA